MNTHTSPSFALRRQREGLRQKPVSQLRPRGSGHAGSVLELGHGAAPDCVFKRFPAIGDTPSPKQRW